MGYRKAAAAAVLLCFSLPVLFAVALDSADQPGSSPQPISTSPPPGMSGDPLPAPSQTSPQIQRGEYLAAAGDCMYCHSVPGRAPYAGGQPVQTPFGDLFSPNITPDKTYGIGNWTDAQFYNAVHNGIGPGHSLLVFPRYLYPLMPWEDYSKLSYQDVMAIKAYLDAIPPAAVPNRPTEMNFPFTIRAGLLAWRILFFHPHPMQYDPSWSPQVRNGAYLVQALGHCSECHTQRNLLMATEQSRFLGGGHILAQSWYAPNISSSPQGVGSWSQADLVTYLSKDGALGTGAPYGPMKEVVDDSLSRLPASDIQDIAAYLQTATPAQTSDMPGPSGSPDYGKQLYADNCARCHGANGEGVAQNFPNLAGNESIWDGPAEDIESMIIGGFKPWHSNQSPMPAFATLLNADQIAAIANYVRTSWGNKGAADATGAQVAEEEQMASIYATLDSATAQATLNNENFAESSGTFELFGQRENCMLTNAVFTGSGPVKTVTVSGACGRGGSTLVGRMGIDGTEYPVTLHMQEQGLRAVFFSGQAGGQNFALRIRLAENVD